MNQRYEIYFDDWGEIISYHGWLVVTSMIFFLLMKNREDCKG